MTMPDPRVQQMGAQPQFPPPNFQGGTPAQVLDPSHPNFQNNVGFQQQHSITGDAPVYGDTESEEYGDYYGFDIRHKYVFPDGKQWIEFKVLSEGDLGAYHKLLKRDVVVEKQTGDARIKIDQVEERHALLLVAITNWHIVRRDPRTGQRLPVPFGNNRTPGCEVAKWIQVANPQFVADLADQIRDANPYLLGSGAETIEAIDKQMDDLARRRAELVERQQGEGVSANS